MSHTLPVCRAMLLARSSTDFLWVHSSRIPLIFSRNIMDPAVFISDLNMDTPMAVASRTATSIFLSARDFNPFQMNLKELAPVKISLT